MDDIKTPKSNNRPQAEIPARRLFTAHIPSRINHHSDTPATMSPDEAVQFNLDEYVRMLKKRHKKLRKIWQAMQPLIATTRRRVVCGVVLAILLLSMALPVLQEKLNHKIYALSRGEDAVLLHTSKSLGDKLKLDTKQEAYMFNQDYKSVNPASELSAGGAFIKAQINQDPAKGVKVTDPVTSVDFTVKPTFDLGTGKQQENRVVFPAFNGGGHLVYTAGAIGIKQEVTLQHYIGDNLKYSYELELADSYAAKLEKNGAIGIYGSSLPINGNINTGNAKDEALLKKARQKAVKDKLLFVLPAPTIKESNQHTSNARAHYELKGNKLKVVVQHLKNASYPLSIDPTVTAASGYGGNGLFSFDANIETNVYIDPSNGFFQRSALTGGNIGLWNTTGSASTTAVHFMGAAVVYAGTLYVIGGTDGTTATNISNGASSHLIEQAKINSDGTIAAFTDGNYSGLPAGGLARFQVLTYNGYIYLINGINGFTSIAAGGTFTNTNAVYYTRITSESFGAFTNGAQLTNWITTTNKPGTQVYDYGATVYNGTVYMAGGLNSSGTPVATVLYAAILPNGDLGAFNTGTSLTTNGGARFGMDMEAYNGHLYILGGNTGTLGSATLTATTLYASIASDGSIADAAWKSGNTLVSSNGASTKAMENFGSQFSMIYNGYMYVTGGCSAVNSTGSCTTIESYTQLTQLNADGSMGTWFPNDFPASGVGSQTLLRTGTPTFGYNGLMYSIAGCSAMNSGTVSCGTTSLTTNYAAVNTTVGDVSNNRKPGDLPVALYGQATVVLNGYLYVLGGCLTITCSGTRVANYDTFWAKINADGSLASWDGTATGFSYAHQDATHYTNALHRDNANGAGGGDTGDSNCTTNGLVTNPDNCGLAGMAAAVYNGYIYVFGGADGANLNRSVYYLAPNASNGSIGTWSLSPNQFSTAVSELGAFAYNNALYIIGGCTGGGAGIGCTAYQTQVQKSTIGAVGAPGAWSSASQLQLPANGRSAFGIALSGNYIYLAGGIDAANNQLSTVSRAKIDSSGNIIAATGTVWTDCTAIMTAPRRRDVSAVVNGYLYVIAGHDASVPATYGDIQIGKIDMSAGGSGDILGDAGSKFTKSNTSAVTLRWNPAIAVGAGFIFVTGGCTTGGPPANCTAIGTVNEAFVVYNADNLGINTWNAPTHYYSSNANGDTNLANRLGVGAAVYNGYMYVAGGCTTFTIGALLCTATANDTAYAPINADGTLGTWVSGGTFATATAFGQLVALNGYLYYMGGQTGSALSTAVGSVYKSTIGTNGAPGAFSTASQTALPALAGRTQASSVTYAGFIYAAGGNTGTANTNAVYYSTINGSGDITAWTATTAGFNTIRRELSLISAGAYLYVIGGYDGTTYYADVQQATPNTSTGDITSWTKIKEIPYAQAGMSAVGSNGYIFLFGGRNGVATTSCSKNTYFAAVNGNGTVSDWQQTPNLLTTARFGAGVVYYNGYFLDAGGHDCTSIIDTTGARKVIEQSGQLSEAIHATYTRYVDFGTDATFRQLYVLGTNAQISGVDIDRWKLIVKTSTRVNNSWGKKFNYTINTFGYSNPITFQALDASGVDQGVSQFWDITFDIDQAQSFNFPDAATPPQITKYDFYFSPGPGKRLRDGKTFVNEQQSTLDAHP